MKKLLLLAVILCGTVWGQETLMFKHQSLDVLSKAELKLVNIDEDKFQNLTFIEPKKTAGSIVYPYIVIKGDDMFLRIVTHYRDSDWIYLKKFYAILDGVKYEYNTENITTSVENLGNNVYVIEKSDMTVTQYLLDFLYAYSNLKGNEEIRYEGESKVKDMDDVLDKTQNRITDLLSVFEKLKAKEL